MTAPDFPSFIGKDAPTLCKQVRRSFVMPRSSSATSLMTMGATISPARLSTVTVAATGIYSRKVKFLPGSPV